MPNWCAGTLRIRGAKENVMKFLDEGFVIYNQCAPSNLGSVSFVCKMMDRVNKKLFDGDSFSINVDLHDDGEYVYVSDTKRAFTEWDPIVGLYRNEIVTLFNEYRDTMMVILPIKQAWGFVTDNWVELSKKYNIDLHLFGWEQGMQFEQEIEIHNGAIVKDIERKYKDWFWECPNPFVGG